MSRIATVAPALALGALLLASSGWSAAAHTVTIQNCIGERQNFYAYNQDDVIMFTSASGTAIEQDESSTLHCEGSQYCKVRAVDAQAPNHRVDSAITFYSRTSVNKFIDADCSQEP